MSEQDTYYGLPGEVGEKDYFHSGPPGHGASHGDDGLHWGVDQVWIQLGRRLGVPYLSLTDEVPTIGLARVLPAEACRHGLLIPVAAEARSLTVAMVDPEDSATLRWLADMTGFAIYPVLSSPEEIAVALERLEAFEDLARNPGSLAAGADVAVEVAGLRHVSDLLSVASWLFRRFGARAVALPEAEGQRLKLGLAAPAAGTLLSALREGTFGRLALKKIGSGSIELEFRRR